MSEPRGGTHREYLVVEFTGDLFTWRGPAPYLFIRVPEPDCLRLREASSIVSYGWGMIPATVQIGETQWTTSLYPKDGGYLVPVKVSAQRAEGLREGQRVSVELTITL